MTTVVIADTGDWQALYIAGTLMAQGHSLDMIATFKLILDTMPNVISSDISTREVDYDWSEEQGSLPSDINDVKWAE